MSETNQKCFKCLKSFDGKENLYRHISLDHLNDICEKWIKCDSCDDLYFPDSEELELHTRSHHAKKRRTDKVGWMILSIKGLHYITFHFGFNKVIYTFNLFSMIVVIGNFASFWCAMVFSIHFFLKRCH